MTRNTQLGAYLFWFLNSSPFVFYVQFVIHAFYLVDWRMINQVFINFKTVYVSNH